MKCGTVLFYADGPVGIQIKKPAAGNPTADCIIRRFLLLQLGIQELAERGLILHVGGYQFAVNDEVRNRKCLDIV